jgi:hypothetical protein
MLRLNMAVPVTQRNDPNFSSLGIVQAAVLGLTNPQYANINLQFIPNMDGFPNGRRLEDDVTRIELQAVSGVALAAIGLWYDDFNGSNPVSQDLLDVLTYTTGVEKNDATFKNRFPYVALPWAGDGVCGGKIASIQASGEERSSAMGIQPAQAMMSNYPNPFQSTTTLNLHLATAAKVQVLVYDNNGRLVSTVVNGQKDAGDYQMQVELTQQPAGTYYAVVLTDGKLIQSLKLSKTN